MSWFKDLSSGVALFVLIGILWFNLQEVPEQAAYYPRALLTLMSGLVVLMLLNSFRGRHRSAPKVEEETPPPDGESQTAMRKIGLGTALVLGLSLIYLLVMPYIGFICASSILLVVFMVCLGVRSIPVLILVPLVEVGLLWFVFEKLLAVLLPNADELRGLIGY